MMIAAALLTLGTGAAFANHGDVFVPQVATAQTQQAPTTVQQQNDHRIFATSDRATTWSTAFFARPGYAQGGEH